MKPYSAILSIFLILILPQTSFTYQSIRESTTMSKDIGYFIFKEINKNKDLSNTLVLFDIDDTLITKENVTFIGSSVFYEFMKVGVINSHQLSNEAAGLYIEPLFNSIYKFLPVNLTDPMLPELIDILKKSGATVIGFTSRERALLDNTIAQLKQFNIKFSNVTCLDIGIKQGLYTIGTQMEKGDAAQKLLELLKPKKVKHLIFFDDRQKNLTSVKNKLFSNKQLISANYIQILNVIPFDSGLTFDSLCRFLENNQDNPDFKAYVNNDSFTKEVYAKCQLKK